METRPSGPSEPLLPPLLGEKQRAAVAAALTILAACVIVGAVVGACWFVTRFFSAFSNVFLPLIVAAVAALVFDPYYRWLSRVLRFPALAVVAVFASILAPLVAFVWFFGALALDQLSDLAARIPEWWTTLRTQVEAEWPKVLQFIEANPWLSRLRAQLLQQQEGTFVQGLQSVGGTALTVGGLIARTLGGLVSWAVFPVYFAFFLQAGRRQPGSVAESLLPFLKAETRADIVYLVNEFINIVVAFFRGQIIIAMLQGLLFAVGFTLIGLRYGFVLGLLLGLLNIIPYLGSIIGLGVGFPLAWFQQGISLVIAVLVVFSIVQLIEAYVLTPRIMGGRTGLHPVVIIIAVFFWGTALNGMLGLVMAVPLTAFLFVCWRLARDKYFAELL